MSRENRRRPAAVACAALLGLLCLCCGSLRSAEPDGDGLKVIFPPHHAVLGSGQFDVICKTPQGGLEADGQAVEWEPFLPPLRVARVSLYPGRNRLQIGDRQLEVFIARSIDKLGAPDGWEVYRRHPLEGQGAKRCADCHQTEPTAAGTSVGEVKSYKACFECHRAVEFELIHAHPLEPIEHCQMCHSLHGSTRKALLKAPAKKLCADCHDS